ncbi:MAG: S9 family peptidase, partial [Propionibacteriaceae bacterium]
GRTSTTEEPAPAGGSLFAAPPHTGPWRDLGAFVVTPRLGELVVSADGATLLVGVAGPDSTTTGYITSWWRVDGGGSAPARRWTRSVAGESTATFAAQGDLLFTSKRPVPPGPADADGEGGHDDDTAVLWCLPAGGGEAYALARRVGGWTGLTAARRAGTVLLTGDAQVSSADELQHAELTALRRRRKISAILHEVYPVRYWDHDLGGTDVRVLGVDLDREPGARDHAPAADDLRDLTPARGCPTGSVRGLSDDGTVAVLDWSEPGNAGARRDVVVTLDTRTGTAQVLARDAVDDFHDGVLSPDGRLLACVRETASTPTRSVDRQLWLVDRRDGSSRRLAADWDAWATPRAFSPDGSTLFVSVDEQGHGPLYRLDLSSGERRRLTEDGTIGSVVLAPDGSTLYAVRSSSVDPGTVIAVDTTTGALRELPGPVDYPALPGRRTEVVARAADGTPVRGWLLLPSDASPEHPAPLALWIHGGPLGSWNAWSWRWCPWLLVSRGYAVLLADPALSTGYGIDFVRRGWGRWGAEPYTDLMSITDLVEQRSDIDAGRTVAMGGSFGGYLANWIAGHTDRFRAIVSHASLWNLETFVPTTDAAWYWARELSPEMRAAYSPHHFADQIRTPMLVVHGDKDYRVPISEGLALWWSLVSRFDGPGAELPHKFLYFPDENHWVQSPQHVELWYETVLAFLDAHVGSGNFSRPAAL